MGEREREEGGAKGEGTGMIFLSQQVCVQYACLCINILTRSNSFSFIMIFIELK
jgi:hypothetical protein